MDSPTRCDGLSSSFSDESQLSLDELREENRRLLRHREELASSSLAQDSELSSLKAQLSVEKQEGQRLNQMLNEANQAKARLQVCCRELAGGICTRL